MATAVRELPFITKIIAPRQPRDVVPRIRLLDALREGLAKRVQVLWAPAGYGKTVVLTTLAGDIGFPVCWYGLTPQDLEPTAFVRYCARASEEALGPLGALGARSPSESPGQQWQSLLGELVTSLEQRLQDQGQLLFIFDDLHHIDPSPGIRDALALFIERAPHSVPFLLASRTRPSLSCLPRLAIQDEVNELGLEALRFSPEETGALLSAVWHRPVQDLEVQAITDRASGWAAGIALLARKSRTAQQLGADVAAGGSLLFDYIAEEFFKTLSQKHQQFLLQSSTLREFTPELCDQLLDRSDSRPLLMELSDGGYFIEERVSTLSTYRYHDLFRDYLQYTLRRGQPDAYLTLHRKAASLAEARGDDGTALMHMVEAGDTDQACLLLRRVAEPYFAQGKWQTLQGWLSMLPGGTVDRDPELLLLRARILLRMGQPETALQSLDLIISLPPAAGATLGQALVLKSYARRLLGNLDGAIESALEGLRILKETSGTSRDMAEGYRQVGSVYGTRGDFGKARTNFELALSLSPDGDLQLRSLIQDGLAAVSIELGELDRAAVHLEKARQGWLKLGNDGALAESLNNLAILYYYRGEFDIAADELSEASRAAAADGYQRLVATVRISQGIVQYAQKSFHAAIQSFLTGLTMARQILDHRLVAEATKGLGNTYRRLGEREKAEVLLHQAILEAEESHQNYFVARYLVALARVYSQSEEFAKALESLESAVQLFREQGSLRGVAEATLCKGSVLYRLGRTQEALHSVADLGKLLQGLGYEGFLVPDGDDAVDLLRLATAKDIGGQAVGNLFQRLQGKPKEDEPGVKTYQGRPLPVLEAFSFGQSEVVLGGHRIEDQEWRSRKAKEILFFLLCQKRTVSKDELIEALWPEEDAADHDDALRMNMHRLRRAVFPGCVLSDRDGYRWNPSAPVEFDLDKFYQVWQEIERYAPGSEAWADSLQHAAALYRGPFLVEFSSEWCESLRRTLELRYHRALTELAKYHVARQEFPRAIELMEKIIASDPFDEDAICLLARGYLQLRDPLSALRLMRDYVKLSREELHAEPSAELLSLYSQASRQGPFATAGVS